MRLGAGVAASVAVAASQLIGARALAQERTDATAAMAPVQLEPLVVTARRRPQDPLQAPVSVTSFSGAGLKRLGVQDLEQLARLTPGLVVQEKSADNVTFAIRGIAGNSTDAVAEPRVSLFQDGVSISRTPGSFIDLFDVSRIEVERGPQTTLYGRAALMGAINILQNKPEPGAFDWNLHLEGGGYGYGQVQGMANLPLGGDLALRVAGDYRRRDGYVDNALGGPALNGLDTRAARAALRWRPGWGDAELILNYEEDRPGGVSFKSGTFYPSNPVTGAVLASMDPASPAALATQPDFVGGGLGTRRRIWSATGLVDHAFGAGWALHSITAFRHVQNADVFDPDGFSFPILSDAEISSDDQWSQEFRLDYAPAGPFSSVGGVNLVADRSAYRTQLEFDEPLTLALLTGALNRTDPRAGPSSAYSGSALQAALLRGLAASYGRALAPSVAAGLAANLQADHQEQSGDGESLRSIDIFESATLELTHRLELSAGGRFGYDDKTSRYFAQTLNGRSVLGGVLGALTLPAPASSRLLSLLATPGAATTPFSASFPVPDFALQAQPTAGNGAMDQAGLTDSGVSWNVTGRYALSASANIYASYDRGRRPQVLSPNSPVAPDGSAVFLRVPAETIDSVEAGVKWRSRGHGLELQGDVYDYVYGHFQTTQLVGARFVTTDAGRARTWGVELQADWRLGDSARVFATYAYTHDRFRSGLYAGNRFSLTPDHALSVSGVFSREALGGRFEFAPRFSWRSKAFFDDTNGDLALLAGAVIPPLPFQDAQGAFGLVDLRLDYTPARRRWTIGAFMNNATDKHYLIAAGNTGIDLGLPTFVEGPPRMIGVFFDLRR
jgi:outer membrane receptor protein involved in Fe transport